MNTELEPIPSYGDLMTIKEFMSSVKSGMLIDYDGYGYWASKTHILSKEHVYPSECRFMVKPAGATHVVWFNR
jgi:hypothetical protein